MVFQWQWQDRSNLHSVPYIREYGVYEAVITLMLLINENDNNKSKNDSQENSYSNLIEIVMLEVAHQYSIVFLFHRNSSILNHVHIENPISISASIPFSYSYSYSGSNSSVSILFWFTAISFSFARLLPTMMFSINYYYK